MGQEKLDSVAVATLLGMNDLATQIVDAISYLVKQFIVWHSHLYCLLSELRVFLFKEFLSLLVFTDETSNGSSVRTSSNRRQKLITLVSPIS